MKPQRTSFALTPILYRLVFFFLLLLPILPGNLFAKTATSPMLEETDCPCLGQIVVTVGDPENMNDPNSSVTYLHLSDLHENPEDGTADNVLTGACVNIYGRLVITESFTFDNCEIILEPGAGIQVTGGRLLTIENNTVLHGCEAMWRGITLNANARLDMENSTIKDAQYAIRAENLSRLRIDGNTFDANYVGVYTPPTATTNQIFLNNNNTSIIDNNFESQSSYLPPFNGQNPDPGSTPYAGFLLNDCNYFAIGDPDNGSIENFFDGLLYGIIDIDGNNNRYSGCQMTNLDASWPDGVGVRILGATGVIKVKHCYMDQVRAGVEAVKYRLLEITSNTINVISSNPYNVYDAGISLTQGVRNALIESNTIEGPMCILVSHSNNGNFPVDIESNLLTTTGTGIYTWLVNGKLNVLDNTIDMNYPEPDPCPTHGVFGIIGLENTGPSTIIDNNLDFSGIETTCGAGIWITDSKNGQVVDNTIIGNSTDFFESSPGIYVGNSPNYLYCCNAIDTTRIGVGFDGMSNDTKISNTIFGDHYAALYLTYAEISPQTHTGNDWRQANTTWDAIFFGIPSTIPFSKFITDPDLVPNGYTQIYVPSGAVPQDWFEFDGDEDEDTGVPTCEDWEMEGKYCGADPYFLVENPNEFAVLTDTDLEALNPAQGSDTITPVLKWEAQRYLYEKLVNNPGLITWNTDVDTFYTESQTGLIGEFHGVESGIRGLFFPPDSLTTEYNELMEDIESLYADLREIGQEILTAAEEEADSLFAIIDSLTTYEINPLLEDVEELESEINTWRGDRIDELQIDNAAISPETAFQEYEQIVFGIYLSTIAQDAVELSNGQQDTLENIAVLCPLIDGAGVYWARAMLRYYKSDQTWGIDACELLEERSGKTGKTSPKVRTAHIFPNPANETLVLQLASPLGSEATLSVYNLNGTMLINKVLPSGTVKMLVDLTALAAGMYLCEVREEGETVLSNRLVVVK